MTMFEKQKDLWDVSYSFQYNRPMRQGDCHGGAFGGNAVMTEDEVRKFVIETLPDTDERKTIIEKINIYT